MIVEMTVANYAVERGVGASAIRKAIKLKHKMPGVVKMGRFGSNHVLYVDKNILKNFLAGNKKVT